jgi:hypothetical protein
MTHAHKWIETNGGPHLLLAEELLNRWRGTEGWHDDKDPADQSDYARACRVASGWLGSIPCSDGTAVVFGGDVGPIAWMPNLVHDGGFLVQWLGIDDEQRIEPILRSEQLMQLLRAPEEVVEFHTGESGTMRLFDSAEPGDDLSVFACSRIKTSNIFKLHVSRCLNSNNIVKIVVNFYVLWDAAHLSRSGI